MIAISDSTPIIYLAKLNLLKLLKKIYSEILIPKEVYKEVVEEGKKSNQKEVLLIEEAINKKFIIVKKVKKAKKFEQFSQLHDGEINTISLCLKLRKKEILVDDKDAYNICKLVGLKPIRTTAILLKFLKENFISFNEFKDLLKNLSKEGYFLDIETFEYLLDRARR